MVKMLLLLVFLSFPLEGCIAQEGQIPGEQAQTAESYAWDFGKVKAGEIATHTFLLKNDSDKAIKIKDVSSSCGCTAYDISSKIIMPKEEARIGVKFNSKGYSGPVKQYVYVHTDSLNEPIIRLTITADVAK